MPVSKLDTINVLDPDFVPETVQDILEIKRAELIKELRQSLKDVKRISTGALAASIDANYAPSEKGFLFTLIMDDYWKFVDKGVNGTLPQGKHGSPYNFKGKNINQQAAREFVRDRSITQWKDRSGKVIFDVNKRPKSKRIRGFSVASDKTLKRQTKADRFNTLAWLAGRAIARYGIEPTNFYSNVVNEKYEQLFIDDIRTRIVELGNNG